MTMTDRERMLAIMDGEMPDRIPWMPPITLWYNARIGEDNMPARFKGMSEREVGRALGIGVRTGADTRVFRQIYSDMEVQVQREPGLTRTFYITPLGTVVYGRTVSEQLQGKTRAGYHNVHPIKTVEDIRVWDYVAEHTYYEPVYEEYLAGEEALGDEGYPLTRAGDCPFHNFCVTLAGYNDAFFLIADYPDEFEHLLETMTRVEKERLWPVLAESPARLISHGVHFDSQMTPPHLFRKYITPYYKELSALLHSRGKKLCWHADDDSKLILRDIKDAGFDMSESFCTAPMVGVTLEEARQVWGKDVIIWGGIASVVLEETYPEEEFQEYVKEAFRAIAPGDAFILGIGDNVMPTSIIERVEWISKFVEEHGKCPIDPATIT